jgi:hypothetical protein
MTPSVGMTASGREAVVAGMAMSLRKYGGRNGVVGMRTSKWETEGARNCSGRSGDDGLVGSARDLGQARAASVGADQGRAPGAGRLRQAPRRDGTGQDRLSWRAADRRAAIARWLPRNSAAAERLVEPCVVPALRASSCRDGTAKTAASRCQGNSADSIQGSESNKGSQGREGSESVRGGLADV